MKSAGYTLLELLFVMAVAATLAGVALPLWSNAVDHMNTSAAARYLAGRIALARLDAVRRSTVVGLRFDPQGPDYVYRVLVDGNGNGLRAADVTAGIDTPLGPAERLSDQFRGVSLGLIPGIPDLSGGSGNPNGVRIGSTPFLSLTPIGTATGGALYVRGPRTQFAIRILGATGRTRVFYFDPGLRQWTAR
jgi:prepilin-type N-terminal cleavage/methylation domain-containing protein